MLIALVAVEDLYLIYLPILPLQFDLLSKVIDPGRVTLLDHYLGDVLPYELLLNQHGHVLDNDLGKGRGTS
jgi:hypothetical protein